MVWIVLIVFALIGLGLLIHWFVRTEPRQVLKTLRWAGLALAVIVGVILIATKQFQLIYALAIFLLPWLLRVRAFRNRMKSARGPTPGQASEVRTRFVVMQLDHDTGHMDGVVQEGPFAGRMLSDLSLDDAVDLFRQAVAEDEASAQVLQAYLERMHGEDWRARAGGAGGGAGAGAGTAGGGSAGPGPGPIGVEEARAILGVGPGASDDEIKRAHRSLMKQFHPDHGGSDYLAARINEAKEVLLGDR